MRKILKYGFWIVAAVLITAACAPQDKDKYDLGDVIPASEVKVSVTLDAADANLIRVKIENLKCVGKFSCPEASINVSGTSQFSSRVYWAGNYIMKVLIYNEGGMTSDWVNVPFSIAQNDPSICTNELFVNLTGGCNTPNGKTWRINGAVSGAIGCGEEGSNSNNWWSPNPGEYNAALLDDDMTFILSGQKFVLDNHGNSFMNESTASMFPDGDSSGSFITTHYTPSANATWSISNEGGTNYLTINNGFPAYAVNPAAIASGKYKIASLTATEMHIVYLPGGISWHYLLTATPR